MAKIKDTNIELSYVDLLSMLKEDLETDVMPEKEKKKVIAKVDDLMEMLFPYSY